MAQRSAPSIGLGGRGGWLLALLGVSCAVRGFSIVDDLPGGAGSGSGGDTAGSGRSGGGGASNQGGSGTSGAMAQGGKNGGAGSLNEGGVPTADAGEPGMGMGGGGAGGAPPVSIKPCDLQSDGIAPLLCDDFESGLFSANKWMPPPGLAVTSGQGPHGLTKLVHIDTLGLAATLGDFNLALGGAVTLSFWLKTDVPMPNGLFMTFRDRSGAGNSLALVMHEMELGWRSSATTVLVPEAPTQAQLLVGQWTCVSIRFTAESMELKYQSQAFATVYELLVDGVGTAGIDSSWQGQPVELRTVAGFPTFGGINEGIAADIYIDDVRISRDNSSVCAF